MSQGGRNEPDGSRIEAVDRDNTKAEKNDEPLEGRKSLGVEPRADIYCR
jgi:hypothetical protein